MATFSKSLGDRARRELQKLANTGFPKVSQPGFGTGKGVQKLAAEAPKVGGVNRARFAKGGKLPKPTRRKS